MGWWNAAPNGASLLTEETGLVWGDGPADSLDFAIDDVVKSYQERLGRKPTVDELTAGLLCCATYAWDQPLAMRPETMDSDCMLALEKAHLDIISQFQESWERNPTIPELVSGMRFSASILGDE